MLIRPLFNKYQKELVKLANLDYGRKFLGIDKEVHKNDWISKLTPNSYHIKVGRNKYKGVFRCYPLFAKKLQGAISKIEITRNEKLYQRLGIYKGLLNYTGILEQPRLFPQLFLDSFSGYAGAGDGYAEMRDEATWIAAHDSTTAEVADATSVDITVAIMKNVSNQYSITRCFYPIDTSSMGGTGATISAATFAITSRAGGVFTNDANWALVQGFQANTDNVVVADFDNCGNAISNPTEGATRLPKTALDGNETGTWTLDATGYTFINSGDWTKLGVRNGQFDCDNSAVPGDNRFIFCFSETTGTASDPTLAVTYTPAPAKGNMLWFPKGMGA